MKKRTIFTLVAMINIIWYTIVVLVANFHDHVIQTDLTVAWFSAWTVELALLFGIRVYGNNSNSSKKISVSSNSNNVYTPEIKLNDNDKNIVVKESSNDGVG